MKKFFKEFETFAIKGNAIDLAVGVVIGTAFSGITNSLVNDIINPILGIFTGKIDFSDKALVLRQATETASQVSINYGVFINTLINFLIVAFALFLVVKQINNLRRKLDEKLKNEKEAEVQQAPEIPAEIKLLTEIRDELKRKDSSS